MDKPDDPQPTVSQEAQPAERMALPGSSARPDLQAPRRGAVFGRRAVVATGQPLASLIGIDVLRAGGNAMDAAIAVSAVMVVVQPYSSHLGGDAFALVRTSSGETVALNAGGRAPLAATPDRYPNGIPHRGPRAVAVPGQVDAWCSMHARFGTKPLGELLAPAIDLAREGFPVSEGLARLIAGSRDLLSTDPGCAQLFLQDGLTAPGALFKQPDLAESLQAIARNGREAFYNGDVGRRLVSYLRENDGLLDDEDLARDQAVWAEPLMTRYQGWIVYEQPLPSQGFLTLEALNIIEGFALGRHPIVSAEAVHPAVEATHLVFADRDAYAGDPDVVDVPIERLLSKQYAAQQRRRIRPRSDGTSSPSSGDTTSFAVADGHGNVVSFIQSVFYPWGAALLVPGTGVLLNNRMIDFSLNPASPNLLRPGKRTVHTLNTWLLEREGGPVYAGGTPGGDIQVQTNLQVIMALVDWELDPQSAIDAPKWALTAHAGKAMHTAVGPGTGLVLESRFPVSTASDLTRQGHDIVRASAWETALCRTQLVGRVGNGALVAASDLRAAGCALSW